MTPPCAWCGRPAVTEIVVGTKPSRTRFADGRVKGTRVEVRQPACAYHRYAGHEQTELAPAPKADKAGAGPGQIDIFGDIKGAA